MLNLCSSTFIQMFESDVKSSDLVVHAFVFCRSGKFKKLKHSRSLKKDVGHVTMSTCVTAMSTMSCENTCDQP